MFDTVEWHYLFDCLKAFNFRPDLINWVKTFYGNIESCVINNGLTSDYFTLARGVRQGDPLSPYLFLLVIQTLAISICKNPEIDGIKIGNIETKVLQYADNTTAVTRLSAINTLEEGGIKMIDTESMIKALRLAWLKRIFNNNDSTWKFYLIHLLKNLGALLSAITR